MADNIDFEKVNRWANDYFDADSDSYFKPELKSKILNTILEWGYQRCIEEGSEKHKTLTGYVNLGGNVGKCDVEVFTTVLLKIFEKKLYKPHNEKKASFVSFFFTKLHYKIIDDNKNKKKEEYTIGSQLPEDDRNIDDELDEYFESGSNVSQSGEDYFDEVEDSEDSNVEGKADDIVELAGGYDEKYETNLNSYNNRPLVLLSCFFKDLIGKEDPSLKLKNTIYQIIFSMKIINCSRVVKEMKEGKGSREVTKPMHPGYTVTMMDVVNSMPESFCELCKAEFSTIVSSEKLSQRIGDDEQLIDKSIEYYMKPLFGTVKSTISKRMTEFDSQFSEFFKFKNA